MKADTEARIAAVILNHGDNANTLRLAASLLRCVQIACVCVADNTGSGGLNGREPVFADTRALFFICENDGYAAGNNRAMAMAEARFGLPDYFLIANPDILIENEAVLRCAALLDAHPELAVAAPRLLRADGAPHDLPGWKRRTVRGDLAYSSGILARLLGMRREAYPAAHWAQRPFARADCVCGACFLVRAAVMQAAGGFDTHTFLFYEEDILGAKLRQMGLGEAVCTDCAYTHLEGVSMHVSLKKYRIMQRSRIYFHRAYNDASGWELFLLRAATLLGSAECLFKHLLGK